MSVGLCVCSCVWVYGMWRLGVQVGCLPLLLSTPPPPGQAFSLSSEFTDWLDWLPPSSMDSTAQCYRLISTHSALYMKAGDPNSSCFQSRHFICHPKPLVVFVQQIKQKCFQFIHRQCTNATAGPLSPTSSTSHTHSPVAVNTANPQPNHYQAFWTVQQPPN